MFPFFFQDLSDDKNFQKFSPCFYTYIRFYLFYHRKLAKQVGSNFSWHTCVETRAVFEFFLF